MTFIELQPGDVVEFRKIGRPSRFDCITHVTETGLFVGEEKFSRTNGRPYYDQSAYNGIFIPETAPPEEAKLQLTFRIWQIASRWKNLRGISHDGLRRLAECFIEEQLDTNAKPPKPTP